MCLCVPNACSDSKCNCTSVHTSFSLYEITETSIPVYGTLHVERITITLHKQTVLPQQEHFISFEGRKEGNALFNDTLNIKPAAATWAALSD